MTTERSGEHTGGVFGHFETALEYIVLGINTVCALVLVWGVICGVRQLVGMELMRTRETSSSVLRSRGAVLRQTVGFYLIIGLELLIAADIIETMIKPTLEQLAILAGVSAIRIATSYTLGKELEHLDSHDPADDTHEQRDTA